MKVGALGDVSEADIRAFQAVFPGSPAAQLVNRMLQAVLVQCSIDLVKMTASDVCMRQAQGGSNAISEVDNLIRQLLAIDLEKEKAKDIEEEDDGREADAVSLY